MRMRLCQAESPAVLFLASAFLAILRCFSRCRTFRLPTPTIPLGEQVTIASPSLPCGSPRQRSLRPSSTSTCTTSSRGHPESPSTPFRLRGLVARAGAALHSLRGFKGPRTCSKRPSWCHALCSRYTAEHHAGASKKIKRFETPQKALVPCVVCNDTLLRGGSDGRASECSVQQSLVETLAGYRSLPRPAQEGSIERPFLPIEADAAVPTAA